MTTGPARPETRFQFLGGSLKTASRESYLDFDDLDDRLRFALTRQVIPQLQALNRVFSDAHHMNRNVGDPAFAACKAAAVAMVGPEDAITLTVLLKTGTTLERQTFYEGLIAQGVDFDAMCEDLLAVVARYLGDRWMDDTMSFSEVSSGTAALQADLIWLTGQMTKNDSSRLPLEEPRSVLVFAYPGERHVLGTTMLAESFRRAGWQVDYRTPGSVDACVDAARREMFDLVAVSLSRAELLGHLGEMVTRIRIESRNHAVKVMVGGPAITNMSQASELGADATSFTGQEAVIQANMLVERSSDHPASRI
jgi:MerR family transcriptional regulator, light-induced transcriptional regulator